VRQSLGVPADAPVLLTVRNLEARMGLDLLLRAVALVRSRVPGLRLLVGGSGSRRGELEALAASLGLGNHVRFLGFVPEGDLPRYYQAADLFVLPTRELEGFGLVAAEALACGTPVVGTPVGAIPEVLAGLDPDLVTDGLAPEALARRLGERLERAAGDAAAADAFRRRCRAYAVERFAWDAVVARLEEELVRLARSRQTARPAAKGHPG
jgi:glycosyltransferase involved in cell wall biosynthesis